MTGGIPVVVDEYERVGLCPQPSGEYWQCPVCGQVFVHEPTCFQHIYDTHPLSEWLRHLGNQTMG